MYTTNVSESKRSDVVRITVLERDGSETVINISEDLHYFLGFAKCGDQGGVGVPAELQIKGAVGVLGELYYQLGNQHPELVKYCVDQSIKRMAKHITDEISKIDPIAEALKKMPTPETGKGWN